MSESETFQDKTVTYSVEINGRMIVVEHVPARVCVETGEQLFSPATVERLEKIIHGQFAPTKTVQVPVYDFAS